MESPISQAKLIVDEKGQDELWEELGEMAREIAWGQYYWEFTAEASEEFILIRKPVANKVTNV